MRISKSHPLLNSYKFLFNFLKKSRLGEIHYNFSSLGYKSTKRSRSEDNDESEVDIGESSKRTKIEQSDNTPNEPSKFEMLNELEAKLRTNQEEKEQLRNTHETNMQKISDAAGTIKEAQSLILPPVYANIVEQEAESKLPRYIEIKESLFSIDETDPEKEKEKVDLEGEELRMVIDSTYLANNIIQEQLGGGGVTYNGLLSQKDNIAAEAVLSHEKYSNNLKEGLDIKTQINELNNDNSEQDNTRNNNSENTGSLIDDFADVSQQQPSHMDPED